MQCEICGSEISEPVHKVIIEGAKMIVCHKCTGLGSPFVESATTSNFRGKNRSTKKMVTRLPSRNISYEISESSGIVDDYGSRIREARRRMGLSYDEVGRKIGEKVSVLKKVESSKMVPNHRLAAKLENILKIKLISQILEDAESPPKSSFSKELTLGDIVKFKKRGGRKGNESSNSQP